MKQISIVEAFIFSVETIKKHPLLVLGPALLSEGLKYGIRSLDTHHSAILLLFLISAVVSAVFSIGLIRISCLAFDNQPGDLRWSIYSKPGKRALLLFMAVNFIILVFGLVGINKSSSSLSYLLCFLIWLPFLFTPYLLVEKGLTLEDSLRTSYRLTKGIKLSLVAFFLSYALISTAISLPFFLLFVRDVGFNIKFSILQPILLTFLQLATVYIYKDVSCQEENPEPPK